MKLVLLIACLMATATASNQSLVDVVREIGSEKLAQLPISVNVSIHVRNSLKTIWISELEDFLQQYEGNSNNLALIYLSNSNLVNAVFVKCNTDILTIKDDEKLISHEDVVRLMKAHLIDCSDYAGNKRMAIKIFAKNSSTNTDINFNFELFFVDNDYKPVFDTFNQTEQEFSFNLKPLLDLSIASEWKRVINLNIDAEDDFDGSFALCGHELTSFHNVDSGNLDVLITPEIYTEIQKATAIYCPNEKDTKVVLTIRSQYPDDVVYGIVKLYMVNFDGHTVKAAIYGYLAVAIVLIMIGAGGAFFYLRRYHGKHEYNVSMMELQRRLNDKFTRTNAF